MDEMEQVRVGACRALARLELATGRGFLSQALADVRPHVLVPACHAAVALRAVEQRARLEALVRHDDAAVALAAFEALSWLGFGSSTEVLSVVLVHRDDELLKTALRLAAHEPMVAAAALKAVEHPKWGVRAEAARALAVSGSAAAVVPLQAALEREPDELTRSALRAALEQLAARVRA